MMGAFLDTLLQLAVGLSGHDTLFFSKKSCLKYVAKKLPQSSCQKQTNEKIWEYK